MPFLFTCLLAAALLFYFGHAGAAIVAALAFIWLPFVVFGLFLALIWARSKWW